MKKKVIIIRETVKQSHKRDAVSFAAALGLLLPGHLIGSSAIELLGVFLTCMIGLKWVQRNGGEMTVAEARAYLDEVERTPDPDA